MMERISMDFLNEIIEVAAAFRIWLGVLCIILAAWCRFQAIAHFGLWRRIFFPVQPSLIANPSPAANVRAGAMGCISGLVMNTMALFLFLVALDLLIFGGFFSDLVLDVLDG
jgi:hypothetical protein